MKTRLYISLSIAATLALASAAVSATGTGFYVGANLGATTFHHDVDDFDDGSLDHAGRVDGHDSGRKIVAGYRFGRHFGLEIGHAVLNQDYDGRVTLSNATSDGGPTFPVGSVAVDLHRPEATFVTAVVAVPVASNVELYGKFGVQSWEARLTTFATDRVTDRKESGVDPLLGVGLTIRVFKRWAVRTEYERYSEIVGDDIDLASVGFVYRFGSRGRVQAARD